MNHEDCVALVTNDIRRAIIQAGLDPQGATDFELGISKAIDIMAKAIQDGKIAGYGGN